MCCMMNPVVKVVRHRSTSRTWSSSPRWMNSANSMWLCTALADIDVFRISIHQTWESPALYSPTQHYSTIRHIVSVSAQKRRVIQKKRAFYWIRLHEWNALTSDEAPFDNASSSRIDSISAVRDSDDDVLVCMHERMQQTFERGKIMHTSENSH